MKEKYGHKNVFKKLDAEKGKWKTLFNIIKEELKSPCEINLGYEYEIVDLMKLEFESIPQIYRESNLESAKIAVECLFENMDVDFDSAASIIHQSWSKFSRDHETSRDDQNKTYNELSEEEKELNNIFLKIGKEKLMIHKKVPYAITGKIVIMYFKKYLIRRNTFKHNDWINFLENIFSCLVDCTFSKISF